MSEDIFYTWKNKRFIVADSYLIDNPGILVILTDAGFWADHFDQLCDWCKINGGTIAGMSIQFDTAQQLTMFSLRWS